MANRVGGTRVGMWYTTGPAGKVFDPADKSFTRYEVVSDNSEAEGCVLVRNVPSGQEFIVPATLIDEIAEF